MKFLIITNHFLSGNSGASFASRAYINAFAQISNECIVLYPEDGIDITECLNTKCKLKGVKNDVSNFQKIVNIYLGRINRFYQVIFKEILDLDPDIIVFDNSRASAGYIKRLKNRGKKVITIHHNYEMEFYKGTKPAWLWRIPFLYYMRKAERYSVLYSDLNLTLTFQDIELLQNHYCSYRKNSFEKIGVFEYNKFDENTTINQIKNNVLCFVITGALDAVQTELSLTRFLTDYYSIIQKYYPQNKLVIAGRNPTVKLRTQCKKYDNIELIANPMDMSSIINDADIYICPVDVGGGLKLRVMDGLKSGLPILAHDVSTRGYDDFREAEFLYSYHNKQTFESSLFSIVNKFSKHQFKKDDIKNLYNDIFSYTAGVKRLETILVRNNFLI